MKTVQIAKWQIEADPEATQDHYLSAGPPCGCLYCRNFRKAFSGFPWFEELGVTPALPDLLSDFPAETPDKRLYIGHYQLAGRLLDGPEVMDGHWNESVTAAIGDFTIGFSRAEDGLMLEFEAVLPWWMDESQED